MLLAALLASLALALAALVTRPDAGRTETVVAFPLAAVLAVWSPPVLLALLGGLAVATGALIALEARTLLYGRRLRTAAAVTGATVPIGAVAGGVALGSAPPLPEVWLAGSVVPGALAYDLRRAAPDRPGTVAVLGFTALVTLALGAALVRVVALGAPAGWWWVGTAAPTSAVPAAILVPLVLAGLLVGVLARWRYGLHAGLLSAPLLAVWSLDAPVVPAAYLAAATAAWLALPALSDRLPGRRLATAGGVVGVLAATATLWAAGATAVGAAGLAAVLAAVLAAEDARLLRGHAGADRTHAIALGGATCALLLVGATLGTGRIVGPEQRALVGVAVLAVLVAGTVVARREHARPSERGLRAEERRWAP